MGCLKKSSHARIKNLSIWSLCMCICRIDLNYVKSKRCILNWWWLQWKKERNGSLNHSNSSSPCKNMMKMVLFRSEICDRNTIFSFGKCDEITWYSFGICDILAGFLVRICLFINCLQCNGVDLGLWWVAVIGDRCGDRFRNNLSPPETSMNKAFDYWRW